MLLELVVHGSKLLLKSREELNLSFLHDLSISHGVLLEGHALHLLLLIKIELELRETLQYLQLLIIWVLPSLFNLRLVGYHLVEVGVFGY